MTQNQSILKHIQKGKKEIWRSIPGNSTHKISNFGRVKSLARTTHKQRPYKIKERILKNFKVTGYPKVNGVKPSCLIHRLIALAFIPNPENKATINHKNGVKDDNRIENLEWATQSENNRHSYRVLGKRCIWINKLTPLTREVLQYSNGKLIARFESGKKAAIILGFSSSRLRDNCRGVTKKYHGFVFKYSSKKPPTYHEQIGKVH